MTLAETHRKQTIPDRTEVQEMQWLHHPKTNSNIPWDKGMAGTMLAMQV